jgi:glutathione synthase/RimK-type ligase-like ATP-grasp enzyme
MSNILILPYKVGSESAKALAKSMSFKRMRLTNSSLRDSDSTTIVNWGNSTTSLSHLPSVKVINKPASVRKASHKGEFFQALSEYNQANPKDPVSIPEWTVRKSVASEWYREGNDVVCRDVLQGHSGEGLSIAPYQEEVSAANAIPASLLYTKYVKKRDEYRVHVMGDVAFFVQKKVAPYNSSIRPNYQIRNHSNGFVFAVNNLSPSEDVISQSIKAVKALGLDFGAVDVIWNERRKKATVIEVNTACSVSGESTLVRYSNALDDLLNDKAISPWDTRVVQRGLQIGSEGYIHIDVDSYYEDGRLLRLSADAMNELRLHYLTDCNNSVALKVLFEELAERQLSERMFTIERLHQDSDWVSLSLWVMGREYNLPFLIHPSNLSFLANREDDNE